MTSLVFGNCYFDYYSYRFGLGFRLGLELGLGLKLVLWVRLFSLIYEMFARTKQAPSLFLKLKPITKLVKINKMTLTFHFHDFDNSVFLI